MKIKKSARQVTILIFLLALCIPVISLATSRGAAKSKPGHTIEGRLARLQAKYEEQFEDRQAREAQEAEFLAQLEGDLQEFLEKGDSGIGVANLFYPTNQSQVSEHLLNQALAGTGLEGQAGAFIEAENRFGINALYLAAIANHESFYGDSKLAQEKNNLFGFNANDADPMELASSYESYDESILQVGEKIKKNYLTESGVYFRGFSASAMNYYYASDPRWGQKVNGHMIQLAQKLLDEN